jgi:hypothetical protein
MPALAPSPELPPIPVKRFTVGDYHRMIRANVLVEDDRVELLEGWICPKMVHNPLHDGTIQILQERIRLVLPKGWSIRIQSAVTTADSEPEPDLAIVRGHHRTYMTRHPGPKDIGLLIEVAESSLEQDRDLKARLYARARVPQYWIANVVDRQIELLFNPIGGTAPRYRGQRTLRGDDLVPLELDGELVARIPAKELLP